MLKLSLLLFQGGAGTTMAAVSANDVELSSMDRPLSLTLVMQVAVAVTIADYLKHNPKRNLKHPLPLY